MSNDSLREPSQKWHRYRAQLRAAGVGLALWFVALLLVVFIAATAEGSRAGVAVLCAFCVGSGLTWNFVERAIIAKGMGKALGSWEASDGE